MTNVLLVVMLQLENYFYLAQQSKTTGFLCEASTTSCFQFSSVTSNATPVLALSAVYLEVENKLLEAWKERDLETEVDLEDNKARD